MADSVDRLASEGVEFVQVLYTDLHGVCRGKDVPIEDFHHKVESGIGLTEAIMTIDLGHNVISGFEHGFRDFFLVPDLSPLCACRGIRRRPGAWATCVRPTARRTRPTRATRCAARPTSWQRTA